MTAESTYVTARTPDGNLAVYRPWRNVRDFGAIGDGIADDTASIARAVADGGAVYFPPGTYRVSSTITLSQIIVLRGNDATIVSTGVPVAIDIRTTDVDISGLAFDSDGIVVYGSEAPQIDRLKLSNCAFRNAADPVFIGNIAGVGVVTSDVDIHSCTFLNVTYGVRITTFNARKIRVRGCYIDNTLEHGILIGNNVFAAQDDMREYVVEGNILSNIGDEFITNGVKGILLYGDDVVVLGNVIKEVRGLAGTNAEGIYTKSRRTVISGNVLHNASQGEGAIACKGAARGVVANPQGYGTVITNNHVFNDRAIVAATGIESASGEALIANNFIEGAVFYGIKSGDQIGGDLIIVNNKVLNTSGVAGIWVASENGRISICGNEVLDTQEDVAGDCAGILVRNLFTNPMEEVLIRGNIVDGVAATTIEAGIRLWGDPAPAFANVLISENIINDADTGVYLDGATKYGALVMEHNHFSNIVTTAIRNSYAVASTLIRRNQGFATEAHGQASLVAAASVVVNHGLARVDNIGGRIQITPLGDPSPAVSWWVSTITATQFTINVDAATTVDFAWCVGSDDKQV